MLTLTDAQAVAAAADHRLINIVSAPGSGKTTIAAERFGYRRHARADRRGVLGLSFTRAAARELATRITGRWGSGCIAFPHTVATFDQLHVRVVHDLLASGSIRWPNAHMNIHVVDDYRGFKGFRWLTTASWRRQAALDNNRRVTSAGNPVMSPGSGFGNRGQHQEVLSTGTASHEDIRSVLWQALQHEDLSQHVSEWLSTNYRDIIIDEVYDAAPLDLAIAGIAAEAGLGLTLVGDPRQALYGWRGATPDKVSILLKSTPEPFVEYQQPESFRFSGDQMPTLAGELRAGNPVSLPSISSFEVDVALARRWKDLWRAGDNVLPLAFRSVSNSTDAAMNLLLDVATRAQFGRHSFGRNSALIQLDLDRDVSNQLLDEVLRPVLISLLAGTNPADAIEELRRATTLLGAARRPRRLQEDAETARHDELEMLGQRMRRNDLIQGLTVHQAKGCEWPRVGVVLTDQQRALLDRGLRELEEEDCILYVALTRAKLRCGQLTEALHLNLVNEPHPSKD